MMDLAGLLLPAGSPDAGTCIRIERPEAGLVVLVLDPPHRENTVLDLPLLRDLDMALDEVERDVSVKGLVLTGREPLHFAYGADIDSIESVTDPELVKRVVKLAHAVLGRLDTLPQVRTVAAVGGPVPGGAFELSLACDCIVLADDPKSRIGLPETQLGILPGWGGCHRLPKRLGLLSALAPILTGKLYRARQAKKLGMVDRLAKPAYLVTVASDIAMGRKKVQPKAPSLALEWLVDRNPLASSLLASKARGDVIQKTRGRYPAPLAAIDIVATAAGKSLKQAAEAEANAIARLATGPVCKSLVSIFRGSEAAKRLGQDDRGNKPAPIERGAVIGAGIMGASIASVMAEKGVDTRLSDLSPAALDAALLEHQSVIGKKRKRRRMEPHAADAAIDRLAPCTGVVGFARMQIIVEAVAERLDIKRLVLGQVADVVADDAILATNTSSLSVDAIAEGLPHPERVVGMHFFNPVRKMPLVEIIRGSSTSDNVICRTAALAIRMGKTPVITKDVPGFLVNRVLGPYLDEALRLFAHGVFPARLDHLLEDFGMPMGPLRLLDEVGFDIARHAAESLHAAYGTRMTPCTALDPMLQGERLGAKTGSGFYLHSEGKKSPALCSDLGSFKISDQHTGLTDHDIVDRCILAMVNEAARCLEEDVVASPADLDLATVFGMGFAPFRGGLLHYADSVGAATIVEKLREIAESADVAERAGGTAKFTPAASLVRMAEDGRSFF
jgi:3-hydroxyacyl-CoA dehydrogenase / enoyl-CoA hydratase / 3-hydroxybutyryl-CoA epimerase